MAQHNLEQTPSALGSEQDFPQCGGDKNTVLISISATNSVKQENTAFTSLYLKTHFHY